MSVAWSAAAVAFFVAVIVVFAAVLRVLPPGLREPLLAVSAGWFLSDLTRGLRHKRAQRESLAA